MASANVLFPDPLFPTITVRSARGSSIQVTKYFARLVQDNISTPGYRGKPTQGATSDWVNATGSRRQRIRPCRLSPDCGRFRALRQNFVICQYETSFGTMFFDPIRVAARGRLGMGTKR